MLEVKRWPLEISALVADYRRRRFVRLPCLISMEQAAEYSTVTKRLPGRRVSCGIENVTWEEQLVPPDHPLFQFFAVDRFIRLMRAFSGAEPPKHYVNCWISRYQTGEYINPHRDKAGEIQVVLCLSAAGQRNGGMLVLKPVREEVRLDLRPGDAVVFEATRVEHHTTPLVGTADCPHPTRVVAVSRYSFEYE